MKKVLLGAILGLLVAMPALGAGYDLRETESHKCKTWACGESRGGEVETGIIYENGKRAGTYRIYKGKDGKTDKIVIERR